MKTLCFFAALPLVVVMGCSGKSSVDRSSSPEKPAAASSSASADSADDTSDTASHANESAVALAESGNDLAITPAVAALMSDAEVEQFVALMRPKVNAFCGDCHVPPRPTSSSQAEWRDEVEQGFMLYRTSGRKDLEVPDQDDVLKYFQLQAPKRLELPVSIDDYPPSPIAMRVSEVFFKDSRPSGITNLKWMEIGMKDSPAIVYCDIGTGAVKAHWPQEEGAPTLRLATLFQPVHVEACDLDADGNLDLIVADIGEFNADDSDLGQVIWLRRVDGEERFEKIVLQDGLSRVSDVRPGDFDGDGDIDLLVAAFGWRKTGRTFLLQNEGVDQKKDKPFSLREVDDRHGPVHVPPVDLNNDGHLDFVALISQDQEVVAAFINDGTGKFEDHVLYQAPDPAYGSSGIELVDMDGDGDLDVLYTNGDSFDRGPKPYHSVQWLENQGSFPYQHHSLALMPGVLNATAGDFDGDGDQDVVAVSLLAKPVRDSLKGRDTSSVVLLRQQPKFKFSPFQIEAKTHQHLSVESGDFDDDGDLDIAVGNFLREGSPQLSDLKIWWNTAEKQ
ncbi:FG-GAP repeat domain-containing protein [Stieleria marina]|uniref:FG-GAP repeat protein n=1 Tax=Stieleria marina TaxID=1930275 RepID=A0A517NQX0_9BACT|nr:FG-GAP repeat protein [Planctomycetes bacterium K23_9]